MKAQANRNYVKALAHLGTRAPGIVSQLSDLTASKIMVLVCDLAAHGLTGAWCLSWIANQAQLVVEGILHEICTYIYFLVPVITDP